MSRPASRGFTLLELLVAMTMAAIVAGALYASLRTGFHAESTAEAAVEPIRTADLAMGLLRPDFESAVAPGGVLRGTFLGTDGTGEGGLPADTLEFYTLGDPTDTAILNSGSGTGAGGIGGIGGGIGMGSSTGSYGRSGAAASSGNNSAYPYALPGVAEVRMVDLLLVPAPSGNVLVRRVTTNILSTSTPEYYDEIVCRGVRAFNVRYYDGSAWQESWDSTQLDNNCPTAVEITMELARPDGDQVRVTRFTRVFLLSCSALWSSTTGLTGASSSTGGTGQ